MDIVICYCSRGVCFTVVWFWFDLLPNSFLVLSLWRTLTSIYSYCLKSNNKHKKREGAWERLGVDNFHVASHVSFVCFCGFYYLGLSLSLNLPRENGPVDPNGNFIFFSGLLNNTLLKKKKKNYYYWHLLGCCLLLPDSWISLGCSCCAA